MIEQAVPQRRNEAGTVGACVALALGGSYLLTRVSMIIDVLRPGIGFLLNALLLLLCVALAVGIAQPDDWRSYLGLGAFDWRGVVAGFVLFGVLTIVETLVLGSLVFAPIRALLVGVGLTQSVSFYEQPLPLAVVLLPAAEELFFRGYVQNRLQRLIGPNRALLVATAIWSVWHFWAPQEFIRRLFAGLCVEGLLFRWRQNTWPSLIVHISRVVARSFL
jgi:membrane protease YdiL (CAAX protease family)